jgi:two-component system, response regulator
MPERTILLVEDNPADVTLTIRALKRANIANELVVARDGVEALDYLFGTGQYVGRDINELPVVVLLDLKLPKIDGIEVLKRIRTNTLTKLVPVVVLTSSKEKSDVAACYEYSCNSYVRKPVDFNQFAEAVKQLGLYWLVLNEPPQVKE